MKKIFYCLCAASAMLFTACSDEAVNAPVEGESLAAIIPEDTLHDAEFVAVYRLSVDNLAAAVGGQLV